MERTVYIKLVLLDKNERPLESIAGRASQGSISINGQSVLRRTCNITLIPDSLNFNNYLWTLNNKFKVEIGILAEDNNILWFPQGIYAITTFSASLTSSNYSVSIQGQDKMVFLNGTIGGHFSASLDAGREEIEYPNGLIVYRDRPLKDIIRDVVHRFGGELQHNIIINDLEDSGKILQAYAHSKDLYLGRYVGTTEYRYAFWGDRRFTVNGIEATLDEFANDSTVVFDYLNPLLRPEATPSVFCYGSKQFNIVRFTYGETIGYKNTDLTYPGELIANPGETITSLLDKIVELLGEFEYFYNLDGQFVFQRKKIYANVPFSPYSKTLGWVDLNAQKLAYTFPNLASVSNFSNNYGLNNVKNDFSIWGERLGIGGVSIPIHLRYAINKKPTYYQSITVTDAELDEYNKKYGLTVKGQQGRVYKANPSKYIDSWTDINKNILYLEEEASYDSAGEILTLLLPTFTFDEKTGVITIHNRTEIECDWRELIYQMARDYTRYGHLDDFQHRVAKANQQWGLYSDGITGYEQYYLDIEGFWRQLYNPWAYIKSNSITDEDKFSKAKSEGNLYYRGTLGRIYFPVAPEDTFKSDVDYYVPDNSFYGTENHKNYPWNKDVFYAPHKLNFWFDFLDTQGAMSKYSVPAIGSRTLVDTKSKARAIHYEEVPNLLFIDTDSQKPNDSTTAYVSFQLGDYSNLVITSSQGVSAKEILDGLLFKHTVATESVSMQALPVYNLEPNTLVEITSQEAGITGEYILNSITIPLSYNGMMSINALKCSVFEYDDAAAILGQAVLGIMILGSG